MTWLPYKNMTWRFKGCPSLTSTVRDGEFRLPVLRKESSRLIESGWPRLPGDLSAVRVRDVCLKFRAQ